MSIQVHGKKHSVTQQLNWDQQETHRAGTNPEVLLLDKLDTLINAFVLQHLQGWQNDTVVHVNAKHTIQDKRTKCYYYYLMNRIYLD